MFKLKNWSIPSFITGKPDAKQHHQLLDIIADHNLHQVTDKPTRNERTLDLLLMNNPSNLNKLWHHTQRLETRKCCTSIQKGRKIQSRKLQTNITNMHLL